MAKRVTPVALTIAGSDCSAGAGIQADLKTFSALGVYGLTAVTCVVAEVPGKVSRIQAIQPEIVGEQIELLFSNFPIAAVKTGLLVSGAIVKLVAKLIERHAAHIPIVVDPVIIATSGDRLLQRDAFDLYQARLLPMATLITPNIPEAAALSAMPIRGRREIRAAGKKLAAEYGTRVLLKGGHLPGKQATDLLFDGDTVAEFSGPFIRGVATHGTGCTYSAAITAYLARGFALNKAIARAKDFVTRAIREHHSWSSSSGKVQALDPSSTRRPKRHGLSLGE